MNTPRLVTAPDDFDIGETPAAPDPLDPDAYVLSQDFTETGSSQKLVTVVPVRRPSKQTWFRTHPDVAFRRNIATLEFGEGTDKEVYLVAPGIALELADNVTKVTLFTTITRHGTVFFTPVRLPGSPHKVAETAASSLREAVEMAIHKWVKVVWNKELGAYETHVAPGRLPDPVWPKIEFAELFRRAFADRVIDDHEHPIIRQLLGFE